MKPLTCDMCGSTDMVKNEGLFVCQSCNTKYSVEDARRMMIEGTIEVTGTVKVDQSESFEAYLTMANTFFVSSIYDKAKEAYSKALAISQENATAILRQGLSIWAMLPNTTDAHPTVAKAVKESLEVAGNDSDFAKTLLREALVVCNIHTTALKTNLTDFHEHWNANRNNLELTSNNYRIMQNNWIKQSIDNLTMMRECVELCYEILLNTINTVVATSETDKFIEVCQDFFGEAVAKFWDGMSVSEPLKSHSDYVLWYKNTKFDYDIAILDCIKLKCDDAVVSLGEFRKKKILDKPETPYNEPKMCKFCGGKHGFLGNCKICKKSTYVCYYCETDMIPPGKTLAEIVELQKLVAGPNICKTCAGIRA